MDWDCGRNGGSAWFLGADRYDFMNFKGKSDMKALRDEFYFEPRVVTAGRIHWYGETYYADELMDHPEETVYIRDSGTRLFVYIMDRDDFHREGKAKAEFLLVCRIWKHNGNWRYGRRNE